VVKNIKIEVVEATTHMNLARVSNPVTLSCFFRIFDTPLKVTTVKDSSMMKSLVNLNGRKCAECSWRVKDESEYAWRFMGVPVASTANKLDNKAVE